MWIHLLHTQSTQNTPKLKQPLGLKLATMFWCLILYHPHRIVSSFLHICCWAAISHSNVQLALEIQTWNSLQTLKIKDGSCTHYICWLVKNLFVCWSNVYSPSTQHWLSKTCSFTDKTFNHNKNAGSKPATHYNYKEVVQNKTLLSDSNFPSEIEKWHGLVCMLTAYFFFQK